ncbi:MAG: choice-of-anchor D domain-containing protein [Bacteroidetes bacterium]|nr:choice-of-anchor D domain-containing protein [Bacteroidota bacterium]
MFLQPKSNDQSFVNFRIRIHQSLLNKFYLLFFLFAPLIHAQTAFSVNNDGADDICSSAWPAEILGNYIQNGTNDGKACYEGPNGYWLYHANMNVGIGASWIVGYPLGSTDVNGANVRFYYPSSASTPPTGVNYSKTPNACGKMKVSNAGAVPPPTPTLNNPYSVGGTSMSLSWSQSAGATGYHVYVSTNSSFTAMVSGLNPKDVPKSGDDPYAPTSTSLSNLSRGTTYYIRVKAYSGAGESSNSNTVSATTIPNAPTVNDATSILDISFQANWSSASGATFYKLYVSTNSSFSSHVTGYNGLTVSGSTSRDVSDLTPSTPYYYRLRAVNNAGESGYSSYKSVTTAAPMPEMDITGNSTSIADGDSSPSSGDDTNFGSADVASGSVVKTFTIANSGLGTLNLTGSSPYVTITGHTSDFSLTQNPSNSISGSGGTTLFNITFNPTTTGTRTAVISIANDDSDENPYNFTVQGTGITPEINVVGNGNNITDGDTSPASTDHTDFGSVFVSSGTVVRTFTIQNTGTETLNLGANAVSLSGDNAGDYSVTTQPATTVSIGESTTFQVTFDPTAAGIRTASISIANNDSDENPYNFSIQGTGTLSISINDVTVSEDEGTATFTLTSSQVYSSNITVDYSSANNTATTGDSDYSSTSGTATIISGSLTTTITVDITNDSHFEPSENFYLNISNASFGNISDAQGIGTISNDDSQPSVTLGLTNSPMAEDGGIATLTATLSNRTYQNVTVNLGYTGTATGGGTDYTSSASLTVNAGSLSNTLNITGVDDDLSEGDETVIVDISSVTNGTESGTQQVTATITDDDLGISVNDVTINENEDSAVFTITLTRTHSSDITIDYATENNTATTADFDYTSTIGTATVTSGQLTTTVSVPVINDTHYEASETFYVNLSDASYGGITDAQGVGTITNEDNQPSVSLGLSGSPLAENDGEATITVTLSNRSYQNVIVDLDYTGAAVGGGTDYTSTASITVNAGSLSNTATINGEDDSTDEENETVIVNIDNVTNGTENGTQEVTATITDDDDPPSISVNDSSVTEGDESSVNLTFEVVLSAASGKTITVDYSTSANTATAGSDFTTISTSTLTFNAGETSKNVNVTILGDLIDEVNETLNLDLTNPTNATILDAQGTGTITDNDPLPGLSVDNVIVTEGNSGTVDAAFTVILSAVSGKTVTVDYETANNTAISGNDYISNTNTLTFEAGATTKTITVQISGDVLDEIDETYYVNLSNAENATISDAQGLGTITDDDGAPTVTLALTDSPFAENGGTATVTATLSAESGKNVTIDLEFSGTATNTTDYTRSNASITINAGLTTGSITLTGVDDSDDDDDETIIIDMSGGTNCSENEIQQVTATITDDENPEISLNGNGNNITDGDTIPSVTDGTDFGNTDLTAGDVTHTFTITNSGTGALHLLDSAPFITITGHTNDFTVSSAPATPVAKSGGITTFDIYFNPTTSGLREATVTIANDDTDENPFIFNIQGTGGAYPEIKVEYSGVEIVDGDATPTSAEGTDFGLDHFNVLNYSPIHTFKIINLGSGDLTLGGTPKVTVAGTDFHLEQDAPAIIAVGETAEFKVKFAATSVGAINGTVSIMNDDSGENPYDFSITGTGYTGSLMIVQGGSPQLDIEDGDTTPRTEDYTAYGRTTIEGGTIDKIFEIVNYGASALNLTGGPIVSISGANAADFTVTDQPSTPISSGSNDVFTIRFDPSASETRTATVSIANNDPNRDPYTFVIEGEGGTPPTGQDETITINEDEMHTFAESEFTFNDLDGDSFAGIILETVQSAGTLTYGGVDVVTGTDYTDMSQFQFTPLSNEYATPYANFTYKLKDDKDVYSSTEYTMTINVTEVIDNPVVGINSGCNVDEGGEFTFSDNVLKANDNDGPTYSLIFVVTQGPNYGTLNISSALMKVSGTESGSFTQNDIANGKVKYKHNGNEAPADTFKFIVKDDQGGASTEESFVITIKGINDPPSLSNIESTEINYIVGQGSVNVTSSLEVKDEDNQILKSASVSIGNYISGKDVLTGGSSEGISASFNTNSGVLNLSGNASSEAYQEALRSVRYLCLDNYEAINSSKSISFLVSDSSKSSISVSRTINIMVPDTQTDNISPPINVSSSFLPNGDVLITWSDQAGNELGFIILRKWRGTPNRLCKTTENYEVIGMVSENVEEFIDSTTVEGEKYQYKVVAYNSEGQAKSDSSQSEIKNALLPPCDLEIVLDVNNCASLKWVDNSSMEDGFIVERKTDGEFIVIDTLASNLTTYLDTRLEIGMANIYRVKAFNMDSESEYSDTVSVTLTLVGLERMEGIPTEYNLFHNYPNPFNPSTVIRYGLPEQANVTLRIYDILGRQIATLIQESQPAGFYEYQWNASEYTSGIYFYLLNAGQGFREIKKMVLIK